MSTHASDRSIRARFLRVNDLDAIKWLAADGPIGRSEDIDRPDQINFAHRRQSKEDNPLGLTSRHTNFLGPEMKRVERPFKAAIKATSYSSGDVLHRCGQLFYKQRKR